MTIFLIVLGITVALAVVEAVVFLSDKMPWNRGKDK